MPWTDIFNKFRSATGEKLLDAGLVEEATDALFMRAQERNDLGIINSLIVRSKGVLISGVEAAFSLGAYDGQQNWRSYIAVMPDGSIVSSAIGDMILGRLGGIRFMSTNIVGYIVAFTMLDAQGETRVLFGLKDDGTWYSYGGNGSARETLHHFMGWGQSNANADQSVPRLTTSDTKAGSKRFSRGSNTYISTNNAATPAARPSSDFVLVPYTSTIVEDRGGGFTDHYKAALARFGRYSHVDRTVGDDVLFSISSRGGTYLTEIGPENTQTEGQSAPAAGYPGVWITLLDDVVRGKAAAEAAGYTYSIPLWIADQGETEGGGLNLYRNSATGRPRSEVRAGYFARAKTMIEQFDAHVRAVTGKAPQTPCLISPPCNTTVIASAWLDLADASDLAIMVGPRYVMPSALLSTPAGSRTHYCPDGQRWIGEMNAKVARRVLLENEDWQPCRALRAIKIDARTVDVIFNVPRGMLVLDTTTFPKVRGWGFRTYAGSPDALPRAPLYHAFPTGAVVLNGNTIRFTFPSDLPAGALLEIGGGEGHIANASGHVEGQRYDGFNDLPVLATGSATYNGSPAYTLDIAGNVVATVQRMLMLDVPLIYSGAKDGLIRSVQLNGSNTQLIGLVSEIGFSGGSTSATFNVGDLICLDRAKMATNVRDSDPTSSMLTFSSTISAWAGKPYPLWNWCCQYDNLAIEGA